MCMYNNTIITTTSQLVQVNLPSMRAGPYCGGSLWTTPGLSIGIIVSSTIHQRISCSSSWNVILVTVVPGLAIDLEGIEQLHWPLKHSWSPSVGLHSDMCPSHLPITSLDHFLYPTLAPLPPRQIIIMYYNNLSILDNVRCLPLCQQCVVWFPQSCQILLTPSAPQFLHNGCQMFKLAIQAVWWLIKVWII